MPQRATSRRRHNFGERTYSASAGHWRPKKKGKEEAKLRAQERAEAAHQRRQESAEAHRYRARQLAEQRQARQEQLKERALQLRERQQQAREDAAERKREAAEQKRQAKTEKMPGLFGTPYEKLSPSQQSLVRKAMGRMNPKMRRGCKNITKAQLKKLNPGKGSFARCVEAVSARGGVTDPAAVCAASKRRTAKGARELERASKAGRKKAARHNLSRNKPAARFTYRVIRTKHKDPLGKPIYGVQEFKGRRMVRGGWFGSQSEMQQLAARMRQEERRAARNRESRANPSTRCGYSSKNPFESMRQGKHSAQFFQTGPHEFSVELSDGRRRTFRSFKAAQAWARLELHEMAGKNPRLRAFKTTGRRRKNPMDTAIKLYEDFHGLPSQEVMEFVENIHYHSKVAAIGPLISMVIRRNGAEAVLSAPDPASSKLEDVIFLTSTEDGRQLIPVGGDQSIPLDDLKGRFGLNDYDMRDHMVIGEIVQITYRTRKVFEAGGEEEIDFFHDLGGDHSKGVLPILVAKPRNPSFEIVGGRYFIAPYDAKLGASPGLVG